MLFLFPYGKGLYKMTIEMLKGKIHRATVIQAELDYVGSITVDEELLEAAVKDFQGHYMSLWDGIKTASINCEDSFAVLQMNR